MPVDAKTEVMPFWKFAEKWFAALATDGIVELRQSGASPSENGLAGLCKKAYRSYVHAVQTWDPKIVEDDAAARAAKAAVPALVK